jgi:hypothetical protein
MGNAGKAVVAALYALAVVAVPLLEGNHVPSSTEWTQIIIAALTAVAVYIVPLTSEYPWIKSAIGALLAGAQILVTVVGDGINGNDVLMIAFAVAGALGIVLAPAATARTDTAVGWGSDSEIVVR